MVDKWNILKYSMEAMERIVKQQHCVNKPQFLSHTSCFYHFTCVLFNVKTSYLVTRRKYVKNNVIVAFLYVWQQYTSALCFP